MVNKDSHGLTAVVDLASAKETDLSKLEAILSTIARHDRTRELKIFVDGCVPQLRGESIAISTHSMSDTKDILEHLKRCKSAILFTDSIELQNDAAKVGVVTAKVELDGVNRILSRPESCKRKLRRNIQPVRVVPKQNFKSSKTGIPNALLDLVDKERLKAIILKLESFGTRWTYDSNRLAVENWIYQQFQAYGYSSSEVEFQSYQLDNGQTNRNVICWLGSKKHNSILICAHHDSTSERKAQVAPGADDNGSGTAVLLEMARILKSIDLPVSIAFASFGGEEEGLYGSEFCAHIASAEQWPLKFVFNMDMIGFCAESDVPTLVIEYDSGNEVANNDHPSKEMGELMAQIFLQKTSLEIRHANIERSDYMPFEAKGFVCAGAYEYSKNPHYHTTNDTVETVDFDYLAEILRGLLHSVFALSKNLK